MAPKATVKKIIRACRDNNLDKVKRQWEAAGKPDLAKRKCLDALVRNVLYSYDLPDCSALIAFLQGRGCRVSPQAFDPFKRVRNVSKLAEQGLILENCNDQDFALEMFGPDKELTFFAQLVGRGTWTQNEALPHALRVVNAGLTVDLDWLAAYQEQQAAEARGTPLEHFTWSAADRAAFRAQIKDAMADYATARRRREKWARRLPLLCAVRRHAPEADGLRGWARELTEWESAYPLLFRTIVGFL